MEMIWEHHENNTGITLDQIMANNAVKTKNTFFAKHVMATALMVIAVSMSI